ncbi:MAG: RluA family pseudouridine synthase [Alphaproteobacteria bacterium]|nr:RluA family pseudouridine synthase [Alphaproteobacteria bacterium]
MPGVEIKKVKTEDDGMRLNRWFLKYYPNLTLGRLQKLLRTKQIKVDGKKAEASLKLTAGSEVRIPPMDEQAAVISGAQVSGRDAAFIMSLVIYKDDNIIVLNKPSGLAVQGGTNTTRHIDGMLEALKFGLPEKPKLVHRIDKDTSGVLVLARNRTWADKLTKAFREHKLPKTYLVLVNHAPKQTSGEIKAPLEKIGEKSIVTSEGKPAVTTYEVLDEVGDKFALLSASPLTGRTHQIRAHMEYIGCPIVGDDKYFGGDSRQKYAAFPDKLYLHAYKIDLSAIYNKQIVIKAALPEHFKKALPAVGIEFKG